MNIVNDSVEQHSRVAYVDQHGRPQIIRLPNTENKCLIFGDFYFSEGLPEKVFIKNTNQRFFLLIYTIVSIGDKSTC